MKKMDKWKPSLIKYLPPEDFFENVDFILFYEIFEMNVVKNRLNCF